LIWEPLKTTTELLQFGEAAKREDGMASTTNRECHQKNVASTRLSVNIATIPPGGVAFAHIHDGFELMLYILEGRVRHEFGHKCENVLENEAGDFLFIKSGVPHEVFNMSDTDPVVAFVARSNANEWDDIVPYDRETGLLIREA